MMLLSLRQFRHRSMLMSTLRPMRLVGTPCLELKSPVTTSAVAGPARMSRPHAHARAPNRRDFIKAPTNMATGFITVRALHFLDMWTAFRKRLVSFCQKLVSFCRGRNECCQISATRSSGTRPRGFFKNPREPPAHFAPHNRPKPVTLGDPRRAAGALASTCA